MSRPHATEPLAGDAATIWAAMNAIYQGFLDGAPHAVDAHLHPDVTIWDSEHAPLVQGLDGLAVLRASRSSGASGASGASAASGGDAGQATVAGIEAGQPVVDVWGDTALLRHVLRVRFAGGEPDQIARVTSVWRKVDGRWLAVHNHEDVLARGTM